MLTWGKGRTVIWVRSEKSELVVYPCGPYHNVKGIECEAGRQGRSHPQSCGGSAVARERFGCTRANILLAANFVSSCHL